MDTEAWMAMLVVEGAMLVVGRIGEWVVACGGRGKQGRKEEGGPGNWGQGGILGAEGRRLATRRGVRSRGEY